MVSEGKRYVCCSGDMVAMASGQEVWTSGSCLVPYQVTPEIVSFSGLQLGIHSQQARCMRCNHLSSFFIPHDFDLVVRV